MLHYCNMRSENKAFHPNRMNDQLVNESRLCTFLLGLSSGGGMHSLKSLLLDLFLVAIATTAAVVVRDNFEIVEGRLISVVPYLAMTLAVAGFVLPTFGISRSLWKFTSMRDYLRVVAATITLVASAVAIGFLLNRLDGVARSLPILQGLLIVSFLVGARVLTRASHGRRVRSAPPPSDGVETVLVIGLNKMTELYLHCLAEFDSGRVRIAGLLGEGGQVGIFVHSHPVLGTPEQVASALQYLEVRGVFVDRIVVATPRNDLPLAAHVALAQIQETTTICLEYLAERMGMKSASEGSAIAKSLPQKSANEGSAVAAVDLALGQVPYHHFKRAIDILASAALLITLVPLFLLVGLLVALDIGLPVIFWQQRPGFRGLPFKLYKFRTMSNAYDADGRRISDSQRASVVGNFLRRSRLDELPQLINILRGEMSFVGPRPLLPVDQPMDNAARLRVRPGLTGWAQINGGRQISATDKAALDVWYVRNMSLALDLEILLRTVPMVIVGEQVTETAIVQAWQDLQLYGNPQHPAPQKVGRR
jgi:lipopolysaccharide/colanic/teichoic acid biosynthesis glycosyltransferase